MPENFHLSEPKTRSRFEKQYKIMKAVSENDGKLTSQNIEYALNIPDCTFDRLVKPLVSNGLLKWVGEEGTGRKVYKMTDKGHEFGSLLGDYERMSEAAVGILGYNPFTFDGFYDGPGRRSE